MSPSSLQRATSIRLVAGVDEVGRGPLVGNVVTAAVILPEEFCIPELTDSKKLSEKKRNALVPLIRKQAIAVAIGSASVEEIDQLNILQATMLAMARAVNGLKILPSLCRIDGNRIPNNLPCPAEAIVKGDQLYPEISAASIIAKVERDSQMIRLDAQYPQYGFARHKGYGTKEHLLAIKKYGVIKEHRRSFSPVKTYL